MCFIRFTAVGQAVKLATELLKFPQHCMLADRASTYNTVFSARSLQEALQFEHENGCPVILQVRPILFYWSLVILFYPLCSYISLEGWWPVPFLIQHFHPLVSIYFDSMYLRERERETDCVPLQESVEGARKFVEGIGRHGKFNLHSKEIPKDSNKSKL